jgi:hypothetical protein
VLLLAADRGARKVNAAIYLGWQLRQRGLCAKPTLLVESLERTVRVDVLRLVRGDPALEDRMLIFRSPFSHAHPDLTRLLEETDRSGWEQLGDRLRERNAYLVFTAGNDEAALFREVPAAQALRRDLRRHPPELLSEELERSLEALGRRDGLDPALLPALREQRDRVLEAFGFAPQVAEFVRFYVDLNRPGLAVEEALRRHGEVTSELLHQIDGDLEAWSFGFTLALAQCLRGAEGVAWVDFDRLHRHVRQWLRRDLPLPAGVEPGAEPAEGADVRLELTDASLLRRCRAEVVKDLVSMADVIRFREGGAAERLWDDLLGEHRRVLTAVLPRLRELAEREGGDLPTLRVLAAQIVGRIGEIDPERIVIPLLNRWVVSADRRRRIEVGPLMVGAVGSRSARYHALCFGRLRQLQDEVSTTQQQRGQPRLQAVIAAYAWVGAYEPERAIQELGAIARKHLLPRLGELQDLSRFFTRREALACDVLLSRVIDRVFADRAGTLVGVQKALTSLCRSIGPAPVFRELRKWIREDGWKMGVLLALVFCHEKGIARELESGGTPALAGGEGPAGNLLLEAMAAGEDEVRQTAHLLGDLYESLLTPFSVDVTLQRYVRESLVDALARWADAAVAVPEQSDAMQRLFDVLARTHDGILREPLAQLLAGHRFTEPGSELQAFAATVRV